jgi:OOP family OmpA-OmpF porin
MKKMKWCYRSLLVLAGTACSLPAVAQSDVPDANRGFYAGATIGMNSDDNTTWRVLGGYDVNRYFGVELGYHDTGDANFGGIGVATSLRELVAVGRLPLDQRFGFYGKAGLYRGKSEGQGLSETNTDLTLGAGVEYNLSGQVALRGEWQRYSDMGGGPFGASEDVDVYSIGVLYRFR